MTTFHIVDPQQRRFLQNASLLDHARSLKEAGLILPPDLFLAMTYVLIAEPRPLIRAGIISTLHSTVDISVAATPSTASELINELRDSNREVDVILMDTEFPDMSGIEVLEFIKHHWTSIPVLVLQNKCWNHFSIRLLEAGAEGVLSLRESPDDLVSAIREVAGGDRFITPDLARKLLDHLDSNSSGPPHKKLSNREMEVFRLVATGKPICEIANQLSISDGTVSTYKRRIREKIGLKNDAQFTRYAITWDLI